MSAAIVTARKYVHNFSIFDIQWPSSNIMPATVTLYIFPSMLAKSGTLLLKSFCFDLLPHSHIQSPSRCLPFFQYFLCSSLCLFFVILHIYVPPSFTIVFHHIYGFSYINVNFYSKQLSFSFLKHTNLCRVLIY